MWDWSTAGKLDKDGKPFKLKDPAGHDAYDSKKGDFRYESNVIPEYIWFNGRVDYTLRETKIDPNQTLRINTFHGSPDDGASKIWPIKRFVGKQPYDVGHNQLLVFHTYGKDDSALWSNFNWDKAIEFGMKEIGAEYSGKYAFVSTEMSWPITHMVAPKSDALRCEQCHAPQGGVGRLDKVPGVYHARAARQQRAGSTSDRLGHRRAVAAGRPRPRRPAHRHRRKKGHDHERTYLRLQALRTLLALVAGSADHLPDAHRPSTSTARYTIFGFEKAVACTPRRPGR
jgi:hypothetical protein